MRKFKPVNLYQAGTKLQLGDGILTLSNHINNLGSNNS